MGEVAVARAAAARGTAIGLSSFASKSIEEVTAANPQTFFQMYWVGTRDVLIQRMERARAAGATGLIITTDWSFSYGRDWGVARRFPRRWTSRRCFSSPRRHRPSEVVVRVREDPQDPGSDHPRTWRSRSGTAHVLRAYGEWMQTPLPTWDDIAWLREQWGGPFMLKGVMRVDDAKRAIDAGVTAISVSNHGGNNLDGTPAPIRALPAIAEAVGDQVEVLLDGGIRRGSDVVKAVALGARAVMIGRAYLWGLSANGQAGVENVLDVLRGGIDSALLGLGHSSIHDLTPSDVVIPPGFARVLGAES